MAKFNSTSLVIEIDGVPIAHALGGTFNLESEEIECTTKDSGGDAEFIYGKRSGTVDVNGLTDYGRSFGVEGFFDAIKDRTTGVMKWTTNQSGDKEFTATVLFTSLSQEAPMEDVGAWNGTMRITGATTKATVA